MCGRPPPPCGGFFLADPEELSLLVYVEQFTGESDPAKRVMYRLRGGNDRLPKRIARELRSPIYLRHVARRIVQTKEKVRVTVENSRGKRAELQSCYAIVTSPATLTAEILFSPEEVCLSASRSAGTKDASWVTCGELF